jgi:hypothetical protein
MKKNNFFLTMKVTHEKSRIRIRIRICTKMSRIRNTDFMAVNNINQIYTLDRIHELYVRMQKKLCYLFGLAPARLGPPVLLGNETGVQFRLLGLH